MTNVKIICIDSITASFSGVVSQEFIVHVGYQSDQKIVDAVNQHHPDILALSALLTTTMGNMKVVIDALTSAGLRDSVKIMVGGAPISEAFAKEIGADGYSANANEAVALAKSLI